ncbi:MAG: UvrD-helicase domain-containing protein [Acidobacteriota bacterium]
MDRIAAVTFTEKAAGELKLRLRSELEAAARDLGGGAARDRLTSAVAHLEEAWVCTIHGFCADLLRECPAAAPVDPRFETLDEAASDRLLERAVRAWIAERLEDPPPGLARMLSRRWGRRSPSARLVEAARDLAQWPDFEAAWTMPVPSPRTRIPDLVAALRSFAALCSEHPPTHTAFHDNTRTAVQHAQAIARLGASERDLDRIEGLLVDLARSRKLAKAVAPAVTKGRLGPAIVAGRATLLEGLAAFARDADAELAALLSRDLREPLRRFQETKARAGRLSFVDLLLAARDMLRRSDEVRARMQERFTHILVDEFQDTDPLQAEILLLLASEDPRCREAREAIPRRGKLFLVGDPKQAIYRFRRADVGIYHEVKRRLEAVDPRPTGADPTRAAEEIQLSTSFRSVPELQAFVNATFAPLMTGDPETEQASYVRLDPHRAAVAGQPAIVALPVPRPLEQGALSARAVERSIPDATAAFVKWLLSESGYTVTERDGSRTPVEARHVAILFRRFESWGKDVAAPYLEALDAREVPHLLVGGRGYHAREEVETLRAALAAVEDPDDELAVFATLKGALFAIDDETLFLYRSAHGRIHPFRIPGELAPDLRAVPAALSVLASLHRGRNHRPVSETIDRLLAETRAHGAFAFRPNGERVLANVLHLAEKARDHEASGALSLLSLIERFDEEAEAGRSPEGALHEEGGDGVRVMTVHKAKGLEFPVVILADLTARASRERAGAPRRSRTGSSSRCGLLAARPLDLLASEESELVRDRAEAVRVAYVAATRARDLLVVPVVGTRPWDGWLAPPTPPSTRRKAPARCRCTAVRCSARTASSPRTRAAAPLGIGTTRCLAASRGTRWSAGPRRARPLGRAELRHPPARVADRNVAPETVAADRAAHDRWRAERDGVLGAGHHVAHAIVTARKRALAPPPPGIEEPRLVVLPRVAGRPKGARFGTLVHATLERVPLDAARDAVASVAELAARHFGAPADEVTAAIDAVAVALESELLQRAHAAAQRGECRREIPITLTEPSLVAEGVVDLAFREGDAWTVVDYKTDLDPGADPAVLDFYRNQVKVYAAAISRATGQRAFPILLGV